MAYIISVNDSVFSISDGSNALVKNKEDILCRVSPSNTSVVEIIETTPIESQRSVIFSSLYTNFSSPTGTTAAIVVDEIITLLNRDYSGNDSFTITTSQTITGKGVYYCTGTITLTMSTSVLRSNDVVQIYNTGTGTITIAGGGINILYSPAGSSATITLTQQYDSATLRYNGTNYIVT